MPNNISALGRLAADPELKEVSGTQVLEFRIGSDVGFGDRASTNWFRVSYWGKRGAGIAPYLKRGSQVLVFGELVLREYTNRDGEKRTSADIKAADVCFAGSKGDGGAATPARGVDERGPEPVNTDDMPF